MARRAACQDVDRTRGPRRRRRSSRRGEDDRNARDGRRRHTSPAPPVARGCPGALGAGRGPAARPGGAVHGQAALRGRSRLPTPLLGLDRPARPWSPPRRWPHSMADRTRSQCLASPIGFIIFIMGHIIIESGPACMCSIGHVASSSPTRGSTSVRYGHVPRIPATLLLDDHVSQP